MSEVGLGTEPGRHECPEGQFWSEKAGKCIPKEEAEVKIDTKELPFFERIKGFLKDYMDEFERRMTAQMKDHAKQIVVNHDKEMDQMLRKEFGLDKDPVVHLSDLKKFARQVQLEAAESGKRTPASPGTSGPEGNVELLKSQQANDVRSVFRSYGFKFDGED